MSDESKPGDLHVSLHGENITAKDVAQTLTALDGLFREVSREMTGAEIPLSVVGMGWVCDGCGKKRPEDHSDWIYRDGDDFCPECVSSGRVRPSCASEETDASG